MIKPINRRTQNKLKILLLAPIVAIVFLVGWSLYWIGQSNTKQPQKTVNKMPTKQDSVELIMIPVQENEALTN